MEALNYLKELYETFVPGTIAWGDISNNRAYAASEMLAHGQRRLAVLRAEERPGRRRPSPTTPSMRCCPSAWSARRRRRSLIAQRHGVQAQQVPERRQGLHPVHDGEEQYDPWLTGCLGYWSHRSRPTPRARSGSAIPRSRCSATATENQFWTGYKGPITQAAGAVTAEYIMVQMCASVASGQATPEEAAAEAERRARRYYR